MKLAAIIVGWLVLSCVVAWMLGKLSGPSDAQRVADEEQRRKRDEAFRASWRGSDE